MKKKIAVIALLTAAASAVIIVDGLERLAKKATEKAAKEARPGIVPDPEDISVADEECPEDVMEASEGAVEGAAAETVQESLEDISIAAEESAADVLEAAEGAVEKAADKVRDELKLD